MERDATSVHWCLVVSVVVVFSALLVWYVEDGQSRLFWTVCEFLLIAAIGVGVLAVMIFLEDRRVRARLND
jgi:hypothetical protein